MNETFTIETTDVYEPVLYRLNNPAEKAAYNVLLTSEKTIRVFDEIINQLKELIKCINPSKRFKNEEFPELIKQHLKGRALQDYGVWVYYSWNHSLVHILDEDEFVEVRTNRNRNKITRQEQEILKTKRIGIIGLSVGQSIALTIAMERTCGEIRLADFDTAELSNLNRLRTPLHNIGLNKAVIAAREIAEIDPFIKIIIYKEGINQSNMHDFFLKDGKIDLMVEVCDSLEIKIISRINARAQKIPVIMDTNDRGMLDIERFDLQPDRPILHGLVGDLDSDSLRDLNDLEKMSLIMRIVGKETISERLRESIAELGKTISNLPQLASSVVLGGAITTDAARRILLDFNRDSGRYYIDTEQLVSSRMNTQIML